MATKTLTIENASLDADPAFVVNQNKFTELQSKRAGVQKRDNEIEGILLKIGAASHQSSIVTQAKAMIMGSSQALHDDPHVLRQELDALRQLRPVLDAAIDLQKKELDHARDLASQVIAEALAPAHAVLVRKEAEALVALSRAIAEEQDFRDALTQKDIAYFSHITPAVFHGPGRLSNEFSMVNNFLNECVRLGFLTRGDVERMRASGG